MTLRTKPLRIQLNTFYSGPQAWFFLADKGGSLVDTIADPAAAIDALVKRNPAMNRESNHRRLMGTLQLEMSRAEGGVLGIGDLDDARFARGIDLLVTTKNLPHHPTAGELFVRDFLPPFNERVRSLVRV